MAKNGINKLRVMGLVILLATLFAGLVGTWVLYGENIEDNMKDIDKLEIDGCKPSAKNTFGLALFQKDMETMQKTQADMHIEQRDGFTAILERLPEK